MTNTASAATTDPAIVSAGRITHRSGARVHLSVQGLTFCGSASHARIVRPLTTAAVPSYALCQRCFTAANLADANRALAMSAVKDAVVVELLARNPVAETAPAPLPSTPARSSVLRLVAEFQPFASTSALCKTCAGGLHNTGGCDECDCTECSTPAPTYARIAA